jgi:hypothetical protein
LPEGAPCRCERVLPGLARVCKRSAAAGMHRDKEVSRMRHSATITSMAVLTCVARRRCRPGRRDWLRHRRCKAFASNLSIKRARASATKTNRTHACFPGRREECTQARTPRAVHRFCSSDSTCWSLCKPINQCSEGGQGRHNHVN